jgi:hypothetical protein
MKGGVLLNEEIKNVKVELGYLRILFPTVTGWKISNLQESFLA